MDQRQLADSQNQTGVKRIKQLPKILWSSFSTRFCATGMVASAQISKIVQIRGPFNVGAVEHTMGKIKLLLGLSAIVAVVYGGAELIPPYFSNYEFEDAIKQEALHSTYSNKTEDDIREEIFKKAKDLEIPLSRDQIQVQRSGSGQGNGILMIAADYSVHVDLPGYPLDLHFTPSSRNKGVF